MRNGFSAEISILLGKQAIINREKRVSCSIGVSICDDVRSSYELSDLIKNADSSLYSVKHTTKNAVKFFEG